VKSEYEGVGDTKERQSVDSDASIRLVGGDRISLYLPPE
jgi:hypothetical protein